jgi:hypothetical protein
MPKTRRLLAVVVLFCLASSAAFAHTHHGTSTSRPYYGGGHHTKSHGGHYVGETNSHHTGGHYANSKTKLMADSQQGCLKDIAALQTDSHELAKKNSLQSEIMLLGDLYDVNHSLDTFADHLNVESERDAARYKKWSDDLVQAFGQSYSDIEKLYGHLIEVAGFVDQQLDINAIAANHAH